MNIQLSKATTVTIVLAFSVLAASASNADERRALRDAAGRGMRALKTAAPRVRAAGNTGSSRNNPVQGLQNLNQLGNLLGYSDRSHGNHNSRDYGYGNPYDSRGYRDHGRDRHDSYADAYRDVGIANAVVGLVSVIANSGAPQVYEQPCGHYERRPVIVQPGHYEETRVWVSEGYDPCAHVDRGHYVIERRWVPEVYEFRDVYVR